MHPDRPTRRQIRRRQRTAVGVACLGGLIVAYLILRVTIFAPVDTHGARVVNITISSRDVGGNQEVGVVVPPSVSVGEKRPLLVFLHGKDETIDTYTEDEAFFKALAGLGTRAPIVAFPEGSADSYWHDRASGDWGSFVVDEVIPRVARRFEADPRRVAIGGISMGGFGAYDLALQHPGRFCAVGGHSPAIWLEAGATAPGAFDDAEDFERNNVIATVQRDAAAFGQTPIWNDYGNDDPFLIGDVAFDEALESGGADLTAHEWQGGHERSYWDRHWNAYLEFYSNALTHCG